jgi:SnoaL-like domain
MNEISTLVDRYLAAWNEADSTRRAHIIAEIYTPSASYLDPLMNGEGHAGLNAMIEAARAQFPGHRFEQTGTVDFHHNHVRFSWTLAPEGAGVAFAGTDVGVVEGGRFSSILGFLDPGPSVG